jgi:hypothetical protein
MDASAGAFPLLELPAGLLDRVVGSLELWDLAAARAACGAMRAAAGRRARRLAFSPATLQCESGGSGHYVQVRGLPCMAEGLLWRGVGGGATSRRQPPDRKASLAFPRRPDSQKRCPTAFQLFPNAREVMLVASDVHYQSRTIRRVEVAGIFRPPSSPADAAAASAALAGVTRLEIRGRRVERQQLAAALAHLPGLRAASLVCAFEVGPPREADELAGGAADELMSDDSDELGGFADEYDDLGVDLVAMLAVCPLIESLHWEIERRKPTGALGPRGRGGIGRSDGWGAEGSQGPPLFDPMVLGRSAVMLCFVGEQVWGGACARMQQASPARVCASVSTGLPPITATLTAPLNPQVQASLLCRRLRGSPPRCRR